MGADGEDQPHEGGLIDNVMGGLVPGAGVGLVAGSAKAYLNGMSSADTLARIEALRASSRPPSAAALAAMAPTPPLRMIAATTGLFAVVGAIFTAVEPMAQNARGRRDAFNGAIAGCAAGSVVGLKTGTLHGSAGACAAFAAMSALIETVGFGATDGSKRREKVYGVVADDE